MKITAMTITNCVQNPPGSELRKSRTSSSPPKARKAAVSIAAPKRMMNTREVVLAVSIITSYMVFSILSTRSPLHTRAISTNATATVPIQTPVMSPPLASRDLTFKS